jgi:hypothetical protein
MRAVQVGKESRFTEQEIAIAYERPRGGLVSSPPSGEGKQNVEKEVKNDGETTGL